MYLGSMILKILINILKIWSIWIKLQVLPRFKWPQKYTLNTSTKDHLVFFSSKICLPPQFTSKLRIGNLNLFVRTSNRFIVYYLFSSYEYKLIFKYKGFLLNPNHLTSTPSPFLRKHFFTKYTSPIFTFFNSCP